MSQSIYKNVTNSFQLELPECDTLDDYLDKILPKVIKWNEPLSSLSFLNKRWLEIRDDDEFKDNIPIKQVDTKNKVVPNSVIKIKLKPKTDQKRVLNHIFGTHRFIYNKLVSEFNKNSKQKDNYYREFAKKSYVLANYPKYFHHIQEEVFDSAFRSFKTAKNNAFEQSKKRKAQTGKGFQVKLHFKTKKDSSNSIDIRARNIKGKNKTIRFWPIIWKFENVKPEIQVSNNLPNLTNSIKLIRNRLSEYYIAIPTYKDFPVTESLAICALDPGVRTFQTLYDPDGVTISFGTNFSKIRNKLLRYSTLQSKIEKAKQNKNKTKQFKNKIRSYHKEKKYIYKKIHNIRSDLHHKLSHWLSTNYKEVLLPDFNTQQMVKKSTCRKINRKTVQSMLTWSHYSFKMLLKYKMARTGGKLIICKEHYTSKTCSNCSQINTKLGSNKIFKCNACNNQIDRDINGAFNIFRKNNHLTTTTMF